MTADRNEIEAFLHHEKLAYQKIELPYGYNTRGHTCEQIKDMAFGPSLDGEHVLDVGSCLGGLCVEALQRGASRAVGLEIDRERIRQAREIARFLDLEPVYHRGHVEDQPLQESFDIVLCLNMLHHLSRPVETLRYLALITRSRLILEVAGLGDHDARKLGLLQGPPKSLTGKGIRKFLKNLAKLSVHYLSSVSINLARRKFVSNVTKLPVCYLSRFNPTSFARTYFITAQALHNLLEYHWRLFQKIEFFRSEHKGRYIAICHRLRIRRMVVVAGVCSSGKSTLCASINSGGYAQELGESFEDAQLISSFHILKRGPNHNTFSKAYNDRVVCHYDITEIERFGIHDFKNETTTDIMRCADQLDVVMILPSIATLMEQLRDSEFAGDFSKKPKGSHHNDYVRVFQRPGWLSELYQDWLDFCTRLSGKVRLHAYKEEGGKRHWIASRELEEIKRMIIAQYGERMIE